MRYSKRNNAIPRDRTPGVYVITNTMNGKVYVGSATSLYGRMNNHRVGLRKNAHDNRHLQAAWNKYGEDAFTFEVIVNCIVSLIVQLEQEWIDKLKAADSRYGYNMCKVAYSRAGCKWSSETHAKQAAARKDNPKMLEAAKRNVLKAQAAVRGKKRPAGFGEKVSAALKVSPKAKAVQIKATAAAAKANKGKKQDPEMCRLRGLKTRGIKRTPEQIERIKANHWSRRPDAAEIAARSAAKQRGKKHTDEHKAKITEGNLLRWQRFREEKLKQALESSTN